MDACVINKQIQHVHGLLMSNQTTPQDVIKFLHDIFPFIIEHLNRWKHNQLFMTYGDRAVEPTIASDEKSLTDLVSDNLNEIQTFFDGLLLILKDSLQFINSNRQFMQNSAQCEQAIVLFLQNLIKSSFIIEKQPGRVLMKDANVLATLRVLLNKEFVQRPTAVEAFVSSQTKVKSRQMTQQSGKCSRKKPITWVDRSIKQPLIEYWAFNSNEILNLTVDDRAEREKGGSVMDEKFIIEYRSSFKLKFFPEIFNVSAVSLPFVFAVHGSQDALGMKTILWSDAFFDANRDPFYFDDEISWSNLAFELRKKFEFQTGCRLTDDHLDFLHSKIFKNNIPTSGIVSWSLFGKDGFGHFRGKAFTFGEWFCAAMKLTRDHLTGEWKENLIAGFISKSKVEQQLQSRPIGTFLLRFSDSSLGGIGVVRVKPVNKSHTVNFCEPFFHGDFDNMRRPMDDSSDKKITRKIADLMRNLEWTTHLWPNMATKQDAFGKYSTPLVSKFPNGYEKLIPSIVGASDSEPKASISTENEPTNATSEQNFTPMEIQPINTSFPIQACQTQTSTLFQEGPSTNYYETNGFINNNGTTNVQTCYSTSNNFQSTSNYSESGAQVSFINFPQNDTPMEIQPTRSMAPSTPFSQQSPIYQANGFNNEMLIGQEVCSTNNSPQNAMNFSKSDAQGSVEVNSNWNLNLDEFLLSPMDFHSHPLFPENSSFVQNETQLPPDIRQNKSTNSSDVEQRQSTPGFQTLNRSTNSYDWLSSILDSMKP